ncbi:MAG TPA: UDP-glucose 4-epimerase GalE [Candidatus Nanopelagicales bacterium]|nr:UDP-glucose 4-epimerase GalE [Candidatus Nanopelagicales bacterium]
MSTWLVTGGAGYIGAHVIRALQTAGMQPVVIDDLSHGLAHRVPEGVPHVRARIQDREAVANAIRKHSVTGVIHLAALKAAGESVEKPLEYFTENVGGMIDLLEVMKAEGVRNLVYSSSAAVYGTPAENPVSEDAPLVPENPYGETKVVGEWLARDCGIAWDLSWVALRYFNVAGAGSDDLGDNSVNNLIPMVFAALDEGRRPRIFGDDYPTPDGTCIRDYIHVVDLAEAHVAAARLCEDGKAADVFNVGRGQGSSVREVMDVISGVIGTDVNAEVAPRRPGDPPATFAATDAIRERLDWGSSRGLEDMVSSAWRAHTLER